MTIEQDSAEDITRLADYPISLILYAYTSSESKATLTEEQGNGEIRRAVAQGHIDVIEYFTNKRINGTDTVFLYPLKSHREHLTCKTVWEIYSLHPLLKHVTFSNYLFLTLDSLYNIDPPLMENCQNLMSNFLLITKVPDEKNHYDKIFICNFRIFSKSTIAEQNLTKTWEALKTTELENFNCMGIAADCKIILNQLFSNLLSTENVQFNFSSINKKEDEALICNSMHRYVLTDKMQKILENALSTNLYQLLIEICTQEDENNVLLHGFLDLSIFMYPASKYVSI